jgi:hypothetical protein
MVMWVNLHGSFMLGLLLPGAFMIEALFDSDIDRRQVLLFWSFFVLSAWLTALLNPEFLAGVLFPVHLLGMKSLALIKEWQPAVFGAGPFLQLEVSLLAGLALGFSGKVQLSPVRLLLLLLLVHAALSHGRHEQLLGIVGALVLAEPFGKALGRGAAKPTGVRWGYFANCAALIATVALIARIILPLSPKDTGAALATVLDRLPLPLRAQPVLNEYSLGGQLIFNGVRPFIDGSTDLYGDAFLARYARMVDRDDAELERALSEYRIAWAIFPAGHPAVRMLDKEPGWQRLAEGNGIVVQTRQDKLARSAAADRAMP